MTALYNPRRRYEHLPEEFGNYSTTYTVHVQHDGSEFSDDVLFVVQDEKKEITSRRNSSLQQHTHNDTIINEINTNGIIIIIILTTS